MNELLTTEEVLKLLNISKMTLYRYIKEGKIKPKMKIKGRNFYSKDDVLSSPIGKKLIEFTRSLLKTPQKTGLDGYLEFLGIKQEEYE